MRKVLAAAVFVMLFLMPTSAAHAQTGSGVADYPKTKVEAVLEGKEDYCKGKVPLTFEIKDGKLYLGDAKGMPIDGTVATGESTYGHYEWSLISGTSEVRGTWVPNDPKNGGCDEVIKLPSPLVAQTPPGSTGDSGDVEAAPVDAGAPPGVPSTDVQEAPGDDGGFPIVPVAIGGVIVAGGLIAYGATRKSRSERDVFAEFGNKTKEGRQEGDGPTTWTIDDATVTDAAAIGGSGAEPIDFGAESTQGGQDVSQLTGGSGINIVTKRGSNEVVGGKGFFQDPGGEIVEMTEDDGGFGADPSRPGDAAPMSADTVANFDTHPELPNDAPTSDEPDEVM